MESLAPGVSRRGTLYAGSSIAALRGKVQPASELFDPDVYLGLVHGVRSARHERSRALLCRSDPSTWHAVRQQQHCGAARQGAAG